MERVDIIGQVATAKSLSRILSAIPLTQRGPPIELIYDIHALQEQFYFGDGVVPVLATAIPILTESVLPSLGDSADVSFAFPDEGAYKRFSRLLPKEYPWIICKKVRNGNSREVIITEGIPVGKKILIIDDLVQTG